MVLLWLVCSECVEFWLKNLIFVGVLGNLGTGFGDFCWFCFWGLRICVVWNESDVFLVQKLVLDDEVMWNSENGWLGF
jgi:hypothetical protein